MKVTINSVHFKADKKLEAFIITKVEKLHTLFEGILGSEVTLKLENTEAPDNKVVEIRLLIPGNDLYAKKQCISFEEATDQVVEALKKQLIKYKEKIRGI
jgi:putative sigma-54 modulation protein